MIRLWWLVLLISSKTLGKHHSDLIDLFLIKETIASSPGPYENYKGRNGYSQTISN